MMNTRERISHRIEELAKRHTELKIKVAEGYSLYLDDRDLKKMKQEKLAIKDELFRLQKTLDMMNDHTIKSST